MKLRIPKDCREGIENQRRLKEVLSLLNAGDYDAAENVYQKQCAEWWKRTSFEKATRRARTFRQVYELLDAADYRGADQLYQAQCAGWWNQPDYEAAKVSAQFVQHFLETYQSGSLAQLDSLFEERPDTIELPTEDFIALKLPRVRQHLAAIGLSLDEEQEHAISRPERRLLINARAGSGKTRTLCARAASAMRDEKLDPNRVLILAFNAGAAAEVKHRVQAMDGLGDYKNARTFHSLAYQLVKSKKTVLFDVNGHPSAQRQSRFVQDTMERILKLEPAFKAAIVAFFRKELEHIEDIGGDLPPEEQVVFLRDLQHFSLRGEKVKSNGEKFIADFLFEHDITYSYERVWDWNRMFPDGPPYKPDFSIEANGEDYILEHWAINPEDHSAKLPKYWDLSAEEYRRQIMDKRASWEEKGKSLIETHTGLMRNGREAFEAHLESILEAHNIRCERLPPEKIIQRVFDNKLTFSRMAKLLLQFIQRAKKRGWSTDEVTRRIGTAPNKELRVRLFHQLALRGYREYEAMLEEQHGMDFDDLLRRAAEEVEAGGGSASIHLGQGRMIPIGDLRWILLDEFQDFSELYFRMLEAILKVNADVRLVAVGDVWQAINAFAGAELRFIKQFAHYFPPGAGPVDLTTNYRSDQEVVAAGNRLMEGRPEAPATPSRPARGESTVVYLGDIWVELRNELQYEAQRQADSVYLRPRSDGKRPSLQEARALKICSQLVPKERGQKTMLLARTRRVYGLELKDFRARLIQVLSVLRKLKPESLEGTISAMTAHRSKGQEAHTVIILDAGQFPKIHPNNLLFELFGVTPFGVLEEERRLFYVAMTRAKHRLFVLTGEEEESPYNRAVRGQSPLHGALDQERASKQLGKLATKIQKRIDELGEITDENQVATEEITSPWTLVRSNVSPSLHDLVTALEVSGLPVPEVEYYLPGEDEDVFAELAWPNASPPVAVLAGDQAESADRWTSLGWRVPGSDLSIEKIVVGVKHYVVGRSHERLIRRSHSQRRQLSRA